MYVVLVKWEGWVLKEEMKEGLDVFDVIVVFLVVESFGFVEEIRKWISGLVNLQFVFSYWEVRILVFCFWWYCRILLYIEGFI